MRANAKPVCSSNPDWGMTTKRFAVASQRATAIDPAWRCLACLGSILKRSVADANRCFDRTSTYLVSPH